MRRFPTTTPCRRLMLAALGIALAAAAPAAEPELRLQGLFCNAEDQLDRALARIGRGLDPHLAAELENRDVVACTWVDRLHYLVRHPVRVGSVTVRGEPDRRGRRRRGAAGLAAGPGVLRDPRADRRRHGRAADLIRRSRIRACVHAQFRATLLKIAAIHPNQRG